LQGETERLRATELSKAQVLAETSIKNAEGIANSLKIKADAELYAIQKEAEGILAIYQSQSEGIQKLIDSFDKDPNALIQYLMLDKGLYQILARENAEAIRGLKPKITIWNTGNGSKEDGSKSDYTESIANIMKMLPPIVTTIHDQTGIKPADWMMKMKKDKNL